MLQTETVDDYFLITSRTVIFIHLVPKTMTQCGAKKQPQTIHQSL